MPTYLASQTSNCKNCYKCIRYCPVKSIRFSGNQAHIMENQCILCGQCYIVCPQQAKMIHSDLEKARIMISNDNPVVASIAPAFAAYYPGITISAVKKALKQLGFYDTEETAVGATLVKKRYEELIKQGQQEIIISSCCHSVNLLIQQYYPDAIRYLARVVSPMVAHCTSIKQRIPNAKTIFIGPCISKKDEAEKSDEIVDCAMTFEELDQWMQEAGVTFETGLTETPEEKKRARFFPISGGIIKSMYKNYEHYTYLSVDGIENCVRAIQDIANGTLSNCFIEMSACTGSCIGGPVMMRRNSSPVQNHIAIDRRVGGEDFDVESIGSENLAKTYTYTGISQKIPGEKDLKEILLKMGKYKPEDELNCGSCGYDTCREKAIAVYQGKANYAMCLPFLKDRAESFSDHIISNTPNGIIVLNEAMEVQQINEAACSIMNIQTPRHVMGSQIVLVLDPTPFLEVLESRQSVHNQNVYLAEYEKYVEQSILYDVENHIIICIMRDVTEEEKSRERKEIISRQTIETANQVVEKQMRVVQEIASLLGETTAETKIALTRLKESFENE